MPRTRFLLFLVFLLARTALADDPALIRIGDTWRYLKGEAKPSPPGANWSRLDFDDSTWASGPSGLVLPEDEEYATLTNRPAGRVSLFVRKKFTVTDPAQIKWLVLRVEHEEGFVAYLNGVEIARHQGVGVVLRNADGEGEHYISPVTVDVSRFRSWLRQGENVLALEGTHSSLSDSEFSLAVALLANFSRGPFVQNASSNSIQVIWRTPSPASTFVAYGVTDALGTVITNETFVTDHVVTLTDLSPGTPYYYRVGSDDGAGELVSDVESFRTFNTSGPVTFMMFADSGDGTVQQRQIADVLRTNGADLVIHAGDIIYGGFKDSTVDTLFFNYYQPHMKSTPYYLAIGNHDLNCCDFPPDWNATNWVLNTTNFQNAFYLPTNSMTGTEHFYSFDAGDVHFVALCNPWFQNYYFRNTNDQFIWLTNDLAASSKPWKVLWFHMPVADSGERCCYDNNFDGVLDQTELMNLLLPVAQRHGVQMIFSGHDHNFERFAPTNGLHHCVAGGGGYRRLYSFTSRHTASAQFWQLNHCLKVTVSNDTFSVAALNTNGVAFDGFTIQKGLPADRLYQSAWNTPVIETAAADDGDGNITGQTFDFAGPPIPARSGQFSDLGRVSVNNDSTQLYVGIQNAMFYANNNIFLFIESPRLAGVSNLVGLGNGVLDPGGEGADGLDMLENLSFTNFLPGIGCVLGDEFADGQFRSFVRGGWDVGQGVFQLDAGFSDVSGVRVQQYNRSPQTNIVPIAANGVGLEQNADFIEIAIPYASLGSLRPGDLIKLGAVVGGGAFNAGAQTRQLDSSALGTFLSGSGQGPVVLGGVRVRLVGDPANPDWDGDGLPNDWEIANGLDPYSTSDSDGADGDPDGDGFTNGQEFQAGTDAFDATSRLKVDIAPLGDRQFRLNWQAIVGKKYQLEYSDNLINFLEVTDLGFPRTAGSTAETYDVTLPPGHASRFYRIRLVP